MFKNLIIILIILIQTTAVLAKDKIVIIPVSTLAGDEEILNINVKEIADKLQYNNTLELVNEKSIDKQLADKNIYLEKNINLGKYVLELLEGRDKFLERLEYHTKRVTEIEKILYYKAPYSEQKWDAVSKARILLGMFHVVVDNFKAAEKVHLDLVKTRLNQPFKDYIPTGREEISIKNVYKIRENAKKTFIKVDSNLKGALVLAEGRVIGETPTLGVELVCGRFHIQIVKDNIVSIPRIIDTCNQKELTRFNDETQGLFIDMEFDKHINRNLGFGFTIEKNNKFNKNLQYIASKIDGLINADRIAFITLKRENNTGYLGVSLYNLKEKTIFFKEYKLDSPQKLTENEYDKIETFLSSADVQENKVNIKVSNKTKIKDKKNNNRILSYKFLSSSVVLFGLSGYGNYKIYKSKNDFAENINRQSKEDHAFWKKLTVTSFISGAVLSGIGSYLLYKDFNKNNTITISPVNNGFMFRASIDY